MITRTIRLRSLQNALRRYQTRSAQLEAIDQRLSNYRLLFFLVCFIAAAAAVFAGKEALAWSVLALFIIVFTPVVHRHRRIAASLQKHRLRSSIIKELVARAELDFSALPPALQEQPPPDHPFAIDLDITGQNSLHHLIDLAASTQGSRLLADWMLAPETPVATSRHRQKLVRELQPLHIFRHRLLMNYRTASDNRMESTALRNWLHRDVNSKTLRLLVPLLSGLALITDAGFVLNSLAVITTPVWMYSLVLYALIYLFNMGPTKNLLQESTFLEDEIRKLRGVLGHIETWRFREGSQLASLCEPITAGTSMPSRQLHAIRLLGAAIGLRMNPVMGLVLNLILPWDYLCALLLQRFRSRLREVLPAWLEVLQKVEALSSLAAFAWLNPDSVYPELETRDAPQSAGLVAGQLGHPLIHAQERVNNDFELRGAGKVVIITGSNMAGKSTFLKTIGCNMVLARAGTTVLASSFRLSPLRLHSCIKISDSISDGFSYFYAEVRRLKSILDAMERRDEAPVFFLIDEIFRGTNNRERLIGSRAYLRALLDKRALGLVSTHDLELVHLADDTDSILNYHFREHVRDGRMVFDYTLRPGPCPTTNALKIMQLEGLPVQADAE